MSGLILPGHLAPICFHLYQFLYRLLILSPSPKLYLMESQAAELFLIENTNKGCTFRVPAFSASVMLPVAVPATMELERGKRYLGAPLVGALCELHELYLLRR